MKSWSVWKICSSITVIQEVSRPWHTWAFYSKIYWYNNALNLKLLKDNASNIFLNKRSMWTKVVKFYWTVCLQKPHPRAMTKFRAEMIGIWIQKNLSALTRHQKGIIKKNEKIHPFTKKKLLCFPIGLKVSISRNMFLKGAK